MNSLLSITDIKDDVKYILDLAIKIKAGEMEDKPLEGKTLAMIFQKSSTRTRVSFDVGMYQLGGRAIFLSSNDLQMGRGLSNIPMLWSWPNTLMCPSSMD